MKDFKSVREILEKYEPVVGFKEKHEAESNEEFIDWLNT